MDGRELHRRIKELFQKYRYCAVVLLAGVFLMLLPVSGKETPEETLPDHPVPEIVEADFETRLSQILSQVEGAGKVQVFLSLAAGEKTLYQTDEEQSSENLRRDTVLVTGSDRSQFGLVQQINPPKYLGAIVLCQGADNASVRLSITQAVANATGLGTNQISVLKMK